MDNQTDKKNGTDEVNSRIKGMTLTQKIAAVTGEIEAVNKKRRPGDTVSFAYRSIDDVMNAINPFLSTYGLTLQSEVFRCDVTPIEFEKEIGNKTVKKRAYYAVMGIRFFVGDGTATEKWEEVAMSEDYADKAVTQATSMCYKYFLTRKFCIPTEDMADGDSRQPDYRDTSHETSYSGPKPTVWLNENTPEWEAMEARITENGEKAADVLADMKNRFKINKRQEAAILALVPGKKASAPAKKEGGKKIEITADTVKEYEALCKQQDVDWSKQSLAIKAHRRSLEKLESGEITVKDIADSLNVSDEVMNKVYANVKVKQ